MCSAQSLGHAADVLSNSDVTKLANAGFGLNFIIQTIAIARTDFDATPESSITLVDHGLTQKTILAMKRPVLVKTAIPRPR